MTITMTWFSNNGSGRYELVELTRGGGEKWERRTGETYPLTRRGHRDAMAECERRNREIARPVAL